MDDNFYKPIWVKVILGFSLVMSGIALTFLMYRFFPLSKELGYEGFHALRFIGLGLGITVVLYITGVIFSRDHPYRIFGLSLMLFVAILVFIRSWVIGW